uniref:Uncharacterized protein n=1 Tax=Anguilla anguilla TaxID=7936 RepID=A0A0E9V1A0_ANGAN
MRPKLKKHTSNVRFTHFVLVPDGGHFGKDTAAAFQRSLKPDPK